MSIQFTTRNCCYVPQHILHIEFFSGSILHCFLILFSGRHVSHLQKITVLELTLCILSCISSIWFLFYMLCALLIRVPPLCIVAGSEITLCILSWNCRLIFVSFSQHILSALTVHTYGWWLIWRAQIAWIIMSLVPHLYCSETQCATFTLLYALALWDCTLCSPTCILALLTTTFYSSFLRDLFFEPEDGGHMFLRNVGWFQQANGRYIPVSPLCEPQILRRRISLYSLAPNPQELPTHFLWYVYTV
jgi:hypothetical protein